jgi:hypothetical protein
MFCNLSKVQKEIFKKSQDFKNMKKNYNDLKIDKSKLNVLKDKFKTWYHREGRV